MKKITYENFIGIKTIRHHMHIARDYSNWIDLYEDFKETVKKEKIDKVELKVDYYNSEMSWCNRDDCEDFDCKYCKEKEEELLIQGKGKVNSQIEEWLSACEEAYEIKDLAPSGYSRMRWAEKV